MVKLVKFSPIPVVALLLVVLWMVQGVFAQGIVDQANEPPNPILFNTIASNMPIGQEFTPAQSPLTGVDVYLSCFCASGTQGITVNIRKGTITSVPILSSKSQDVLSSDGFVHFDLPSTIVDLGQEYVLEVASNGGGHVMSRSSESTYPGGSAIIGGSPLADSDFLFRTYSESPGGDDEDDEDEDDDDDDD